MKRVLAALCALAGASGCYGTTYVETPAPQYGTTMEYIPDAPPAPISVTIPPPAPRYEPVLTCGYGTIYVPGRWDWTGRWYGRVVLSPVRPGTSTSDHVHGGTYTERTGRRPATAPRIPVNGTAGVSARSVYGGGTVVAPPPVYRPAPEEEERGATAAVSPAP